MPRLASVEGQAAVVHFPRFVLLVCTGNSTSENLKLQRRHHHRHRLRPLHQQSRLRADTRTIEAGAHRYVPFFVFFFLITD